MADFKIRINKNEKIQFSDTNNFHVIADFDFL